MDPQLIKTIKKIRILVYFNRKVKKKKKAFHCPFLFFIYFFIIVIIIIIIIIIIYKAMADTAHRIMKLQECQILSRFWSCGILNIEIIVGNMIPTLIELSIEVIAKILKEM